MKKSVNSEERSDKIFLNNIKFTFKVNLNVFSLIPSLS